MLSQKQYFLNVIAHKKIRPKPTGSGGNFRKLFGVSFGGFKLDRAVIRTAVKIVVKRPFVSIAKINKTLLGRSSFGNLVFVAESLYRAQYSGGKQNSPGNNTDCTNYITSFLVSLHFQSLRSVFCSKLRRLRPMLLLLYHNSDKMQLFFCKDSVNHNLAIHDFNKKDKLVLDKARLLW